MTGRHRVASSLLSDLPAYQRRQYKLVAEAILEKEETGTSELLEDYKEVPVTFEEFVTEADFLDCANSLYPEVMKDSIQLNNGQYLEAVLTGAIGTGKTTIALYTTAYQLYLLACLKHPQRKYGLDPASEIIIIFQSISASLAKSVDFARFKSMLEGSPYFTSKFPFRRDLESELRFPNRIIVKPVSGADTAAIGQNVIGGVIDELNFMAVTDNSKQNIDGGTYDQAVTLYNTIARRRKSRFMSQGKMPGILCLVSSKRYPGQFTDTKQREALSDNTIFVYDKRTWDIKPDAFVGEWFNIFIGDDTRTPRIIVDGELRGMTSADKDLVMSIPVEYRLEFENDIMSSLRDIAGVSTLALHPFIMRTECIAECQTARSILSTLRADFIDHRVTAYKNEIQNPEKKRWVHLDLALTGDSAGVVMGYCDGFEQVHRGDHIETLPKVVVDFTLEVTPPRGGEILFYKIRELIYSLRDILGINIKWITLDSYQSADTIQQMRQKGYVCDTLSMDTSTDPYEILKQTMYDGRLSMPDHPRLASELAGLERDTKKNKIDHPSNGSKDIADALAGVVYGLSTRAEVWLDNGIPPTSAPHSLTMRKENPKEARVEEV